MAKVVTFGELLLRLSPPNYYRFRQATALDVIYGGGEANVAVSLAKLGMAADYITRLPDNEMAEAAIQFLRQHTVGVDKILRGGERLGIYFLEVGAMQRGSNVIYDRAHSSMATIQPGMVDWASVFADADWFHWSGITPALSESAAAVSLEAVQVAREMGVTISCDLNYRTKLWKWGKNPREVMPQLAEYCDVIIGHVGHMDVFFGIRVPDVDVISGVIEEEHFQYMCREFHQQYPAVHKIATTMRQVKAAQQQTFSAMLWTKGTFYNAPTYQLAQIIDRVGSGDAFTAGLIYGLQTYETRQEALNFGTAAGVLKHSIFGDFNLVTRQEVEDLMNGKSTGRVAR